MNSLGETECLSVQSSMYKVKATKSVVYDLVFFERLMSYYYPDKLYFQYGI